MDAHGASKSRMVIVRDAEEVQMPFRTFASSHVINRFDGIDADPLSCRSHKQSADAIIVLHFVPGSLEADRLQFALWITCDRFHGGINQHFNPLPKVHFRLPIVVTIERQHKGFFDNVRDRETATNFGLDLRVSLDPTSNSISQTLFNRIHRFAELFDERSNPIDFRSDVLFFGSGGREALHIEIGVKGGFCEYHDWSF